MRFSSICRWISDERHSISASQKKRGATQKSEAPREDLSESQQHFFAPDRYFSYTASFGAFTSVSWSTPQNVKNVLGHAAYILEGIRSLADIYPIHMRITADGQLYEEDFIFGAVCNSTSLGGVLKLEDSEVHMSDGRFEALFIPFPPNLIVLNRILSSLRTHYYDDDSLHFLRASVFAFEGPSDLKWTLDGEEAAGGSRIEIRNLHNAVKLVHR